MKEKTIDYVLRTTWLAVKKMYNEEASNYSSTMATGFTLLSIDPENGTPSTSLGPKMGIGVNSLSRILSSMEIEGLIKRKPNPNDGRGVLVHLTNFGIKSREKARERVLMFNNSITNNISKEKIDSFFEVSGLINKLIRNKLIFTENKDNAK
ncbi:MarR family transcriptional regulator [Flavobacteriaceae bacterium]|nr:MarR family transcriptional regulator [Flavobacteriaceae bacterium]